MLLIGIIAKKRDIQAISKMLKGKNIKIIEITKESIKNIKNITFEEIICLENINLNNEEYKYMKEIISKTKFVIFNGDIEIDILNEIDKKENLITIGFNSKSTITISSVSDEKIIAYIRRDIKKANGEILEQQEKELLCKECKKIYNNLAVFITNELHNL